MSKKLSVGQIGQLIELDHSREDVGDEVQNLIDRLKQGPGKKKRQRKSKIVDLDAPVFIPDGWEVEEHQKGGQFEWNATKVKLFVSVHQQNGRVIQGHKLRNELKSQKVFNANLLDFLYTHPCLIPEKWRSRFIYFWGTVYRHLDGDLCVRYLFWRDGHWHWRWYYLARDWREIDPAAVLTA